MKINKIMMAAAGLLCLVGLSSCEYDNYEAPSRTFSGRLITSDGQPFQYDSAKTLFQFYQSGYGKIDTGIGMRTDNDGSFTQLLFDADYELTPVNRALPFEIEEFPADASADQRFTRMPFKISGNVTKNFVVHPYYKITNLNATLEGKRIVATFDVTKMKDTAESAPRIKRTYIYLCTSIHVNSNISCQRLTQIKGEETPDFQTLSAAIPLSYYRDKAYYVNNFRTYAYYRVALELEGITDYYLMSEIKKIEDLPLTIE